VRDLAEIDDEMEAAERLRRAGWNVTQIARELDVSKASVSAWVQDIKPKNAKLKAVRRATQLPAHATPKAVAYRRPQFSPDGVGIGYRHHHTKTKGDVAEAVALGLFAVHGFMVSKPFSENSAYDLIVDDGKRLAKVQVKHARLKEKEGAVVFSTCSANASGFKYYTSDDCDVFAAWCADLGTMYVIPQASIGELQGACLRLSPPRNRQPAGVRWAREYEFDGTLPWPDVAPGSKSILPL
jgi:PD-(D/E)XK endonuclease/Putative ATPase subunit of terminase (gpP-like)